MWAFAVLDVDDDGVENVFQKSMLECVTRIQFRDVIISDWGLESNRVEMKKQYAKLLKSCDTQA
jgi:hypothetical protein